MPTITAHATHATRSAFMPLIGTTSALVGLIGVALVMGIANMVTAMM